MVPHSYEAYCVDEAVTYFGLSLENMLEEAGAGTPGKEELKAKRAREAILDQVFGKKQRGSSGFSDPAAMFG